MRSASLLLYLSLGVGMTGTGNAGAAPAPRPVPKPLPKVLGPTQQAGPYPGYLALHARTRGFQLGRPQRAMPTPDGQHVLFLRSHAESAEQVLMEFDVASGQSREVLTPSQLLAGRNEQLSPEEQARRERLRQTARGFTSFELFPDGMQVLIPFSGKLYVHDRGTGQSSELKPVPQPSKASSGDSPPVAPDVEPIFDAHLSPDGKRVAYLRGRNVFLLEVATKKERQLSHSTHPQIAFGSAEFVAQEELHRFTGHFFSPDSQYLVVTEVDNRPVETLYVGDVLKPELAPTPLRYPRAGTDNAIVKLLLFSTQTTAGAPTPIEWNRTRFPYLATVTWQAGAPLLLTLLSREQRDLEVAAVELVPETGAGSSEPFLRAQRLFGEREETWINLDQDLPRVVRDSGGQVQGMLWRTERNGGPELELRNLRGQLVRVLVPREEGFRKLLDVDADGGWVTYLASAEPIEQHVFRTPLLGGSAVKVSREPGFHAATFGKSHSVYVEQVMAPGQVPKQIVRRTTPTGMMVGSDAVVGELPSVATAPPYVPNVEFATVGGQGYRVAIVRPRKAVPGQKYPVLVDVYGGPHHSQVMSLSMRYLLDQWIADHGFVVFLADGRGTPGRGSAWERAVAGNFGDILLDDQVAALQESAVRFPELDMRRVGIFGWSFGGYMAALAVMRRPDVFQVGVAGAPVVDWRDYDTAYTERYLGLPQQNREGYEKSSLLTYAKDLERPLLLIHGTADDNVLFMHSLKLSNALFRAGRQHELLPLPGLTHMVPDPLVSERMWSRIVTFLSNGLRTTPGAGGARR